jgi:antitoxin VapB
LQWRSGAYILKYILGVIMTMAKVFRNGASQAVRLPKQFRFDTDEVCVKQIGKAVLLFPKDAAWDMMEAVIGKADADFLPHRRQPAKAEKRKRL